MANRRPARKPPQPRPASPAEPAAPVLQAVPVWNPPTPRAVARLGGDQRAALDRVSEAAGALQRAQDDLRARVVAARSYGVSWAVIGHAVGTTGEAARQRWGSR